MSKIDCFIAWLTIATVAVIVIVVILGGVQ